MAILNFDDLKKEYQGFKEPLAVIKVNGQRITDSKKGFIIDDLNIDITSGYEASTACFDIYNCYDALAHCFMMEDLKKYICLGSCVKISMGYVNIVKEVFTGFIARVSYLCDQNKMPHITVFCMDAKGIMMANQYCRQLTANFYSDAVSELLQKPTYVKLKNMQIINQLHITQTPDKGVSDKHDEGSTIEMVSESDYEFIVRSAKRFNYEFFSDCGDLYFRKAKQNDSVLIDFDMETGIKHAEIQYDCSGIAGQVTVRGTDVDKGKVIEATLKNTEKISIGNFAKQLVKNNQKVYVNAAVKSKEDADRCAQYLMEENAYRFGLAECVCDGLSEIKPGYYFNISGIGEGAANQFYIVNVIHTLNQNDGFTTKIIGKAKGLEG